MQIKNKTVEIPEDNPFANCQLDRKPFADSLTNIVSSFADGFVLAINNDWGTGKTTFLKMWEQHLKKEEFQTIYFNAWENDFDNDPLVAIISELKTLTRENDKGFKKVLEHASTLFKNVAPDVAKAIAKSMGFDGEVIANSLKGTTEIIDKEIKDYTTRKQSIVDFRTTLEKFLNTSVSKKPIVFIVDELDRCRPNYAVEVLEKIKHLFSVSGIVFVLSIDKKHLSSSVRGFYGSELIDSDEYLRRFIDLELSMPAPSITQFNNYLCEYYGFKDFFLATHSMYHADYQKDYRDFIGISDLLFTSTLTTLRQMERIMALTRLVLCTFRKDENIYIVFVFILVYLKVLKVDLFNNVEINNLTLQQLSDEFSELFKNVKENKNQVNVLYFQALLVINYDMKRTKKTDKLISINSDGSKEVLIASQIIDNPILNPYNQDLLDCLESIDCIPRGKINLNFLISKININSQVVIS